MLRGSSGDNNKGGGESSKCRKKLHVESRARLVQR
jgi:hypothetical protein